MKCGLTSWGRWCAWLGLALSVNAQFLVHGTDWPAEALPPAAGAAADFAPRRAGAEVAADVRFGVSSSGLYRVTQPQLVAAGWAASNIVGGQLRLFCRTQEVAVAVSTNGPFGAADFIQFHGAGHRGYYTPTNVYWLASSGSGLRMAGLDASTNAGGTLVTSHFEVVEYGPDKLYRDFYRPLEDGFDHWFAELLTESAVTYIPCATDQRVGTNAAIVLKFFGLTSVSAVNPDHRTMLIANGNVVTSFVYDGEGEFVVTSSFTAAWLNSGISTVGLLQTQSGVGSQERAYLDFLQIGYERSLVARNGQLTFSGRPGTNVYEVGGLATNAGVTILDVTDHATPVLLTNWSYRGSGTNGTACFLAATTNTHRYFVCASSSVYAAESPRRVFFRDLAATSRQADYLLIAPYAFREPAYRLLKHRFSNGLAVAVAPLEDIYNEFGYGIEDAAPIQQFIGYAFHHWSNPPPRFALLAGEGTYDPRGFLGPRPEGHLPAKMGPTPFSWSPRDNWFGAVNGADNLVDVSIGRIAARTAQELTRVVNKTVSFEGRTRITNATLVADNYDLPSSYDFKAASQDTIYTNLFPAGYSVSQAYLDGSSAGAVRATINGGINSGRYLVTFYGHGQTYLWCQEDVWNTNDVRLLTNARFPIVTVFSCQNGSFEDPDKECMAETFLEGTTNGAVAVMAPASESAQVYALKISAGFFAEFTNQNTRLGDSLNAGLLRLWQFNANAYELWSYGIQGDPALVK